MMIGDDPPCESDADYDARRAGEAFRAAELARTLKARDFHHAIHAIAETYCDRAAIFAQKCPVLNERERLLIDRAFAASLAGRNRYPHAREAHRRIASEIQRRIDAMAD